MPKVAINGLGRIGRATLKILLEQPDIDVVAVNDIAPADDIAYLLKHDSVYGRLPLPIETRNGTLSVGARSIRLLDRKDPSQLPWKNLGCDVVIESTGVFRRKEDLDAHLDAGAGRVVLSAPAKGDGVTTIVPGVNASDAEGQRAVSCASCTTNCVVPVLAVLNRRIGVASAQFTTVHAYTASQSLVDAPAKKRRRGRAAALNLVPTTTGAADAAVKVLPELDGRLHGIAVRCPVPAGSVTEFTVRCKRETNADELNGIMREEAASAALRGVLGVSEEDLVSSDIIGDPRAAVVDLSLTSVVGNDLAKLVAWYDNEWGYAAQLVRLVRAMTGLDGAERLAPEGEGPVVTTRARQSRPAAV